MSFNPNEPPQRDDGTGPRQNQEPQGDEAASTSRSLREIMASSPTTTIPIRPARGRQHSSFVYHFMERVSHEQFVFPSRGSLHATAGKEDRRSRGPCHGDSGGGKKAPTAAQIATALDEMGWTPEALEKEVARRQQRQRTPRYWPRSPPSKRRRRNSNARATRKMSTIRCRWSSRCRPNTPRTWTLNGRYRYVVMRIPQAEAMRNKLLASYRRPAQRQSLTRTAHEQGRVEPGDPHGHARPRRSTNTLQVHQARRSYLEVPRGHEVVLWRSLEWQKVNRRASRCPFCPPRKSTPGKPPRNLCGRQRPRSRRSLDALVKREAEILEEMLQP